ncbi:16S rRNA processing protein RimM [Candidatus Kinetoplastibacterium oncopeltii TCC290E]|uniref:Ribosome maturation factor RimM n=1 Tax=Candidatus Kinetoplastidibacterium stringomonadis TCC290E TaxID=1208920 RepID=M1LZ31_9PROT|nr:ribosome maturation factor RimM [Candidatus Kinetoplastibacterium oncopeltii]AGF48389.1 16S rRNA processing protein RimM [Candidatus Kinetoplastibacterium oncopeltii TCC290E]
MSNYLESINTPPGDLVDLGRIVSSYGVNGLLKIYPYSDDKSILLNISDCWIFNDKSKSCNIDGKFKFYHHNIINAKTHGRFIIAKFNENLSREDANELRGYTVCVSRSLFPAADDNEYYWVDLIGCIVHGYENETSCCIGTVSNIFENGAHPILIVKSDRNVTKNYNNKLKTEDILVPFVKSHIINVNLADRCIFTNWQID